MIILDHHYDVILLVKMLIWAPFLQRCVLFLSVLTAVHILDLPKNYHLCGSILKETTIPHKLWFHIKRDHHSS